MNEKIKGHQLERGAYVYVRQSTPYQVRNHLESKERQYALAQRASQLGFHNVIVIDEDLGRSGSGIQERPGFGRLLASVCQGLAGAVLALEASRLARNNRDWHHLVDLCALTETLLIDCDGIYDPRLLNDRLVLGLKGTMSEFELGLLRQRARESFEQKARRGFAMWELPVGFIRSDEGRIEKPPIGRYIRQSQACFRSSANWEVLARRQSGSGRNKYWCPKSSPALRDRGSYGPCRAAEESVRCCTIRAMPERLHTARVGRAR
jgi:DNA invertase Pin-like site-specific DNA recombinase